jgi:glucose/arabinose dehydrogenase
LSPHLVVVPKGYRIDLIRSNLNTPVALEVLDNGDYVYADSGLTDGNGKIIRLNDAGERIIASDFEVPVTGVTYHDGAYYVSYQGGVTKVTADGKKEELLVGLPSYGDHKNNRVTFGPDGKMYFGQGTATNSGVVGIDNRWLRNHSYFHDYPAKQITLRGKNFESENIIKEGKQFVWTGAFAPFGTPTRPNEVVRNILPGAGSILRADPDGSNLELVAWGFRNPYALQFDHRDRLWVANQGMDERGSRPIKNSPDEFTQVLEDQWYGWPDYTGGYPVTHPFFKPNNGPQPEFILKEHPSEPKRPLINFIPHTTITGFSFNPHPSFGQYGDVYLTEFGPTDPFTTGGKLLPYVGHRVSRIDMTTGELHIFAQNSTQLPASESNGIGFERPIDLVFGPDESMYILDFGVMQVDNDRLIPQKNTGAIWKVTPI